MLKFDVQMQLNAATEDEAITKAKAAKEIANSLTADNLKFLASLAGDSQSINKLLSNSLTRIGLKKQLKK